jgi:hypothetical protein
MSLVMMNLVLGLAISDISELEKVSKVYRVTTHEIIDILTIFMETVENVVFA